MVHQGLGKAAVDGANPFCPVTQDERFPGDEGSSRHASALALPVLASSRAWWPPSRVVAEIRAVQEATRDQAYGQGMHLRPATVRASDPAPPSARLPGCEITRHHDDKGLWDG